MDNFIRVWQRTVHRLPDYSTSVNKSREIELGQTKAKSHSFFYHEGEKKKKQPSPKLFSE